MNAVSAPASLLPESFVPRELLALLEQSPRAQESFGRLNDRDRAGMVAYVEEAKQSSVRQHRAAVVAMSLYGLATDLPEDRPLST
ncbi:hypothetical protein AKJ09_11187 [Labilithrix luteola]|uniref:Uncharacterized protein n=1 Tax=Labilithrix luteola TaxID=1391654 RepID=A0A0K1QFI6_9BACT|nr:YdeI/OmpD-associated family protein [Labilithrix luteola]AKV04524.1 hypothetical protein AKJ09_11187 [Labilithrix luteola]